MCTCTIVLCARAPLRVFSQCQRYVAPPFASHPPTAHTAHTAPQKGLQLQTTRDVDFLPADNTTLNLGTYTIVGKHSNSPRTAFGRTARSG